jgi:hypothetical protein
MKNLQICIFDLFFIISKHKMGIKSHQKVRTIDNRQHSCF